MTRLFAIRPEPGLAETIATAATMGLEIVGEPLFAVGPVEWEPVDADAVDALLVGSANAFRHGGAALAAMRGKPVHVVGAATAVAARDAGFTVATTGSGGLQRLVETLAPPLRLFRPAGEARVDLDPPSGVTVIERTVYRSAPRPLPPALAERLGEGGTVLLHSAVAGAHFAAECERLGIARDRLRLLALAPRILAQVGAGWRWTAAAPEPSDAALLALARELCLTAAGSKNGR